MKSFRKKERKKKKIPQNKATVFFKKCFSHKIELKSKEEGKLLPSCLLGNISDHMFENKKTFSSIPWQLMSENSYDSAVLTSCVSRYNKMSVWENVLQLWSNILMAFCWHVGRKENTVFLFSLINTLIWNFRFSLLASGCIWIVILPGNFILVLEYS